MTSKFSNPAQQEGTGLPTDEQKDAVMAKFEQAKVKSQSKLNILQRELKRNVYESNKVRAHGYLMLVQLYLWYLEVKQEFGLWEYYESTVQTKRSVVKDVKSGTNFSTLLKLGFQQYLNVDSNFISRKNILLNQIDKEFRTYPERYTSDVEKKLQTFLLTYKSSNNKTSAPVVDKTFNKAMDQAIETIAKAQASATAQATTPQTASTQTVANYVGSIHSASTQSNTYKFTDTQRISQLREPAMAYFLSMDAGNNFSSAYNILPNEKLKVGQPQSSRKQPAMSIALIAQNEHGKFFIDASLPTDAPVQVQEFFTHRIVHAYRDFYSALPVATRSIFETLRTQMLTDALVDYEDSEREKQQKNLTATNNLVKAHHRLTFRTTTNDFLFSRSKTKNGVVTIAKPKSQVFASLATDVYMGKQAFTRLYKIMATRDTHMFTVEHASQIPLTEGETLIYAATSLVSRTNINHKIDVPFQNIVAGSNRNHGQVSFNQSGSSKVSNWSLTPQLVKSFATDAIDLWIDVMGKKIRRDRNQLVQFTVDQFGLNLHFDFDKDGDSFVQQFSFAFPKPITNQQNFSCVFKSIDLMPVLSCLGSLELIADVQLICNKDSIVFQFETSATHLHIAVPMHLPVSKEKTQPIAGFETYTLLETPVDEKYDPAWHASNELTN